MDQIQKLLEMAASLKKRVDAMAANETDKPTVATMPSIECAKLAGQFLSGGNDEARTEAAIKAARENGDFDKPARTFHI